MFGLREPYLAARLSVLVPEAPEKVELVQWI